MSETEPEPASVSVEAVAETARSEAIATEAAAEATEAAAATEIAATEATEAVEALADVTLEMFDTLATRVGSLVSRLDAIEAALAPNHSDPEPDPEPEPEPEPEPAVIPRARRFKRL